MLKRITAVVLSVLLMLGVSSFAFAEDAHKLSFDENGEFVVMNICDMQDGYPASKTMLEFIREAIALYHPDVVVLGGDNTVGGADTKADAIKEICDFFIENQTYFTLVFGNHDNEQGVDKETLFDYYKNYGGEYCLAYDADEALTGVGTHNLPVYSSDGSKVSFNLWMFDSNTYVYDENDNRLGYDAVHEDQINWYKNLSAQYKAANGGVAVPAFAFQHIVVQEADDALFAKSPEAIATQKFDKAYYSYLPLVHNINSGFLLEAPCCGYYNYGQFDAFLECGDVIATVSGHDHVNSYSVNYKGIDIVNTPGATFNSYGKAVNRGLRVMTVKESNPTEYTDEVVTISELCLRSGSKISDTGFSKAEAFFGVFFEKVLDCIVAVMRLSFYPFRLIEQ